MANLSNIGGGGGGVAAALQSGALKFFDTFGYDRIGLSCRLRNDVCQMSGVGSAGNGYYILKGAGLPHLDIIGNRPGWTGLDSCRRSRMAYTTAIASVVKSGPGR